MPNQISIFGLVRAAAPSASATNYNGPTNGLTAWVVGQTNNQAVLGGSGTYSLTNWDLGLAAAPGAGGSNKSYTFTIQKNEVDTTAIITISETATTGGWSGLITFSPADRINYKCVPANTPTATGNMTEAMKWSGLGQPLMWSSAATHTEAAGQTFYLYPAFAGNSAAGSETDAPVPFPCDGTIDMFYGDLETDPGNTRTFRFTLRKGTGGGALADTAIDFTITGNGSTNKTGSDLVNSVTVAQGDAFDVRVISGASATTTRARFGYRFTPTVASYSVMMQGGCVCAQNATNYTWGSAGPNSTLSSRQATEYTCTLRQLTTNAQTRAPASGQAITSTANVAGSDTTLSCVMTGTGTTANDSAHPQTVLDLGLVAIKIVTSATTGTVSPNWGIVLDVPQPPSWGIQHNAGLQAILAM